MLRGRAEGDLWYVCMVGEGKVVHGAASWNGLRT